MERRGEKMPQSNEYMLKQDDAELIYQKKLTAGTNITIDPVTNTISSTGGGGSSVSYSGSLPQGYGDTIGIITIDGTQYPIKVRNLIQGSNINIVQDMATGNLTISSTAQGTRVEPNPSGTATENLYTVNIDGTIYDIKSGNGNFKTKVLLNQAATSGTYSLADDYTNYDLIAFWTTGQGYESSEAAFYVMTVDDIKKAQSENRILCMTGINRWFNFHITTSQFIVDSCSGMTVVKIVGYKIYADCYNPIIYSTEEREVGVWVDNKPLYAKTYNFNSFVRITNSGTDISQYIDNRNDIEILVRGEGFSDDITQAIQSVALWVGYSTRGIIMAYCAEGATVNCVTLYYTKTTDVAGSGSYNTLGVPNVHYTTDEQVIGTWIDGKPLYQKTFDLSVNISSTSRAWYTVLSASDVQNNHMDKIFIDQEASYAIDADDGTQYPIPYSSIVGSTGDIIGWAVEEGAVKLCMAGISIGTTIGKMTLRYTKTTD